MDDPLGVQQTKWTLAGQLLNRKDFNLSVPDRYVDFAREGLSVAWNCYCRTYGEKTVTRLFSEKDGCVMDLVYDHSNEDLSVRFIDSARPIIRNPLWTFCAFPLPRLSTIGIITSDSSTSSTSPTALQPCARIRWIPKRSVFANCWPFPETSVTQK